MRPLVLSLALPTACHEVDALSTQSTANHVAADHLDEARVIANHVELACPTTSWMDSPVKGTTVDKDPDVLEVSVRCIQRSVIIAGQSLWVSHKNLRGTTPPTSTNFRTIGIGKSASVGSTATSATEETVRVPSIQIAGAVDLCIHRELSGVEVCIAYRAE